jgi:hypothetical protein
MVDPKMTRFKAMSIDEHVETIEKLAQEALRSREEITEAKATEVQNRGFSLIPEAH